MVRTAIKSLYISTLLLASASVVSAQEEFRLNGVIMVKGSTNRVALAEITNKRTKYTVGSNDLGIFQIKAVVGDTLLVIKRSFSDVEQVVLSDRDMIIYVDMGNTLNQVNIRGQSKKQELDELRQDYRDKGSFYQGKPPLLSYIFAPLTALYELFGSTPKKARRFGKFYNTEMQQTAIDGFFNEALIQKNTELEGKDLENFMLNYRPEYSKSRNWTEYDAVKYIRDSYKQYTDTLRKK
ncbi:MAG: hypothetical protein ABWY16_18980 [Pedobacter sp.]|jgi:hypothetical protein|uniref:hypothetical protein n=1 Tax=Pedobacter sp. TaxID=1411316 RepID=UPI003392EB9F